MDFLKSIHNDCHVCISEINLKVEKKKIQSTQWFFHFFPLFQFFAYMSFSQFLKIYFNCMNIPYSSLEEQLICEGKLSQSQITEIRRVFTLLDTDKNGLLPLQELNQALHNLSRTPISPEEVKLFFSSLDFNQNGAIEWPEFLRVIAEWLQIFKDPKQTISDYEEEFLSPQKRRNFHDQLSLFFKQFKVNIDFFSENERGVNEALEDLENRSVNWNYAGKGSSCQKTTNGHAITKKPTFSRTVSSKFLKVSSRIRQR